MSTDLLGAHVTTKIPNYKHQGAGKGKRVMGGAPPASQDDAAAAGTSGRDDKVKKQPLSFSSTPGAPP
jgi:hypothetical protein